MLADSGNELILLATLWNWDTTSIKIGLQAALAPLSNGEIECVLGLELSIISGLGPLVTSLGSGGTVSGGGRLSSGIASQLSLVLASNSLKLSALRTMWNFDTILVSPGLDLAIVPSRENRVENGVSGVLGGSTSRCGSRLSGDRCLAGSRFSGSGSNASSGLRRGGTLSTSRLGGSSAFSSYRLSRGGGRLLSSLSPESGQARVAANRCNQLVTCRWLWNRNPVVVEPFLQVRLRPGLVDPIAGVRGLLLSLLGRRLVVRADCLEVLVTLAGLWYWDVVLVGECLELRIGPAR